MFSNPKQVFIVPKPNQSTEIITFILMMGSYSFYKEEDLEKLVDFPVSSQPDDEESRKQSENANQRRFCWNFLVLRLPKLCFLQSSATFLPGRPRKQALHHLLIRPMCLSHAQTTTHWWKDIQSNLEDALFHFLPWGWASCFFCRSLEGVFFSGWRCALQERFTRLSRMTSAFFLSFSDLTEMSRGALKTRGDGWERNLLSDWGHLELFYICSPGDQNATQPPSHEATGAAPERTAVRPAVTFI